MRLVSSIAVLLAASADGHFNVPSGKRKGSSTALPDGHPGSPRLVSGHPKEINGHWQIPRPKSCEQPTSMPATACGRVMNMTDLCSLNVRPPKLPSALVSNARIFQDRHAGLLAMVPEGGKLVEVGTMNGEFARFISRKLKPERLEIFDMAPSAITKCESHFAGKIAAGKVRCKLGSSADLIRALPDNTFDMIYIDAGHAYEFVCADLEAARTKVKPGGLIVLNDYYIFEYQFLAQNNRWGIYGVVQATNEFILRYQWPMVYLAMHQLNMPDIAIRRPA
mmetsp:Transcript_14917/g.34139  ORF Transcript_14917/g.34139 Transcript_14917/m.34139 type:complete len:279 (-) Transcript_14917:556-1392(-)|eukprot:CAMPEP_0119380138 /NCGR_PEP_ID=MMETSP1334-20130426/55663_1 /TAXON_ID=127549 /ORGANISM="Calcidiscus leptoporus, Strain RCC1130" /LENGTH=278 /DNA_ID=CAMNT_0007399863 /DNA_START=129 /DNA_END=965 /DNA_ORIENTATION=+